MLYFIPIISKVWWNNKCLKCTLNLLQGSSNTSTVGKQKSSKCEFRAFQRLDWIKKTGYGREEYTSELLRSITEDFGPITSFTGYYQLSDKLVFRIILHVGGNPLQVIPFRDTVRELYINYITWWRQSNSSHSFWRHGKRTFIN